MPVGAEQGFVIEMVRNFAERHPEMVEKNKSTSLPVGLLRVAGVALVEMSQGSAKLSKRLCEKGIEAQNRPAPEWSEFIDGRIDDDTTDVVSYVRDFGAKAAGALQRHGNTAYKALQEMSEDVAVAVIERSMEWWGDAGRSQVATGAVIVGSLGMVAGGGVVLMTAPVETNTLKPTDLSMACSDPNNVGSIDVSQSPNLSAEEYAEKAAPYVIGAVTRNGTTEPVYPDRLNGELTPVAASQQVASILEVTRSAEQGVFTTEGLCVVEGYFRGEEAWQPVAVVQAD